MTAEMLYVYVHWGYAHFSSFFQKRYNFFGGFLTLHWREVRVFRMESFLYIKQDKRI